MRGLKTLVLRMQRHSDNAALVAEFLDGHPAVETVLYPGLPGHPGHQVAARQMSGFGGMVSVRMRGGPRGRTRLLLSHRDFHPCRIPGRGGVADRVSGRDDARVHRGLATGGARRPRAAVGRHRGFRRPARRPRSGAYASAPRTADAVIARFTSGSAVGYSSTQLPLAISPARACTHRQPRSLRLSSAPSPSTACNNEMIAAVGGAGGRAVEQRRQHRRACVADSLPVGQWPRVRVARTAWRSTGHALSGRSAPDSWRGVSSVCLASRLTAVAGRSGRRSSSRNAGATTGSIGPGTERANSRPGSTGSPAIAGPDPTREAPDPAARRRRAPARGGRAQDRAARTRCPRSSRNRSSAICAIAGL